MYTFYIIDYHINMKNSYKILLPIIILNIISLLYLSTTKYITRHLIYLLISYILLIIVSKININFLLKLSPYLYYLTIILLTIVLIFGKEINGSKAWLNILGLSIQPSEIAKLSLILYLPYITIKRKNIILPTIITIIPSILTLLEPDTGAIIIYLIIFLSIIKHTNIKKKTLIKTITIILLFIITNITIYIINKDIILNIYGPKILYRIDRLISFQKQNNIQTINSLISIGSHKLIYIPENHNDFIFSSIISKYSPIIFITIIISYIAIFTYYLKNITKKNNISNIINSMILNMLLFQSFYNILMNLSLLPIIGIPLPFISYGGSYLLTLYITIGISISLNNNKVV